MEKEEKPSVQQKATHFYTNQKRQESERRAFFAFRGIWSNRWWASKDLTREYKKHITYGVCICNWEEYSRVYHKCERWRFFYNKYNNSLLLSIYWNLLVGPCITSNMSSHCFKKYIFRQFLSEREKKSIYLYYNSWVLHAPQSAKSAFYGSHF